MSSLGLYFVGAQDRLGDYKTKAVSVLSVDQNGQGYGKGAVSMLSKSAGMYSMEVDASLEPFPDETRRGSRIRPEQLPYVESGQEQSRVTFKDVAFWSPRTVTVNLPDQNYGHIQNNLFMDGNHLTGEIKNKFSYDFEDVYLVGQMSAQLFRCLDSQLEIVD